VASALALQIGQRLTLSLGTSGLSGVLCSSGSYLAGSGEDVTSVSKQSDACAICRESKLQQFGKIFSFSY
jgi:hypothetical protein